LEAEVRVRRMAARANLRRSFRREASKVPEVLGVEEAEAVRVERRAER
jgi:hypothetical protein